MLRPVRKDAGMSGDDDRFERRLVEETSKLRVELAGVEVRLTDRMAQSESTLRQEIGDVIKWTFAFWVGQVIVMTALMNALLR